jgi:hypothetical protein
VTLFYLIYLYQDDFIKKLREDGNFVQENFMFLKGNIVFLNGWGGRYFIGDAHFFTVYEVLLYEVTSLYQKFQLLLCSSFLA